MNLFENRQYGEAAKTFQRLVRLYPSSQRVTASYLMGARAFLLDDHPADAVTFLKPLFIRFPQSTYLGEALTILAQAQIVTGDYRGAAKSLVVASVEAAADSLKKECGKTLVEEVFPYLPEEELDEVIAGLDDPRCTGVIRIQYARYLQAAGRLDGALSQVRLIEQREKGSDAGELEELLIREMGKGTVPLRIVLILPLKPSGAARTVHDDLASGVRAAVEKQNDKHHANIELVRLAYTGDINALRLKLDYLEDQENVIGIIGGLFTSDTREIIEAAAGRRIPFLAPSATANGLTGAGEYIFQLNSDYATRGAALAEYARKELHATRAAIVSPLDSYGKLLADGFQQTADRIRLRIEAVSWYQGNELNLASQIYSIRNSLNGSDSIDVLYAPVARREQIVEIATQCLRQGLRCRLLGSGDWNDREQLRRIPIEILPVDMEGDYYVDESTAEWNEFSVYYRRVTSEPWSKTTLLGYDAADLLCSVIRSGRITRASVRDRLSNVRDYRGVRGRISFSKTRVSSTIPILRFENGTLRKLIDIHAGGK